MMYRLFCSHYYSKVLLTLWLFYITLLVPLMHSSLTLHLFIAIPLLMVFGYIIGKTIFKEPKCIAKWNRSGIPAMLLANVTFIFWMIPRFLDESIQQTDFYLYKVLTLTFFCGLPLAWSFKKASYITINFFRIEFIATLFRMAWLFITAKNRLCVNYLYSEQATVGNLFLLLAILFSLWPAIKVIFGQYQEPVVTN